MNLLLRLEQFLFNSPVWKLVTVILLVMLFKTGIWYIPNLEMSLAVALNPFANPFTDPNAHYLLWNWLSPFLAWLLGIKAFWVFFLLHFSFALAFTALFIRLVFTRLPEREARISLLMFALLPVSATAYFWTGPDALTLLLLAVGIRENQYLWALPVGILLGMQHFEQALFAVSGLLVASLLDRKRNALPITLLFGIVAGKLVLGSIFTHFEMQVNSGRAFWLHEHIDLLLGSFFLHLHHILWSVLGLGWLVALKYADQGRQTIAFFLTLAGLLMLLLISADQTRVLAIITFPLLAVYWLFNQAFLASFTNLQVAGLLLLWVVIPWGWVWIGEPRNSALPFDLAWLLHSLFGWFDVPANPALWPFADEFHKW